MIDWHKIAREYGYWTDCEMLNDWYVEKNRTSYDIAEQLSITANSVCNRLKKHGIPTKQRGGIRNKGGYKCVKH